jgi:hypothetical protein
MQTSLGGKRMLEEKIYQYYAFGYDCSVLRAGLISTPIHGDGGSLIGRLDSFFNSLGMLNLQVTKIAASDLQAIRDKAANLPNDAKVDLVLASEISKAFDKLDATLDAELKLKSAYLVTPKRFPLEYLLINPRQLFAANVFEQLPDLCQYDFSEAGRCIAFNLPTAAAFHLMRGTEGVLRFYYLRIVKHNRVKRLMWGEVVDDLRKRRHAPPKTLMDSLDNIRVNFRNPTQHPDARYDSDEAQDLLALSTEVVNRLIRDLSRVST